MRALDGSARGPEASLGSREVAMNEQGMSVVPQQAPNQAAPATGWNAFGDDRLLVSIADKFAPWAKERAGRLGAFAGDEATQELARLANKHVPELKTHDRFGNRLDWVDFHPAWHELMALAFGHEVHSLAWTAGEPGAHTGRALLSYVWNQIEQGVGCPLGMTYAAYAGLAQAEFAPWREKILSTQYDKRPLPAVQKTGATIGYAMTEKQGGSDLRQTQTTARFVEHSAAGEAYLLSGHKWFFSVPQSDGFFTLAQAKEGVTCFFVPGFLPDGARNRLRLQRLKDKCGNRSNASSEVEFHDTLAWRVGESGRGIPEILSHAHLTRLDFAVASAGLMRQALTLALNHGQTRRGFGAALADLPMMTNVLADLAIDCEAATVLAFRAARATDEMAKSEHERRIARVSTPLAKFWNCKRAAAFIVEALECHGGNGFIEENPMARLYREAPLNAIWEGTSNMMCLDVLRAMRNDPRVGEAFIAEVGRVRGADAALDGWLDELGADMARQRNDDGHARRLAHGMALALQGAELHDHGSPAVFEAFCRSRLQRGASYIYGTLEPSPEHKRIIERAAVVRH
jgi:putative acyl-CoA dehydrogenase